jgi:hypothetical protein
VVGIKALAYFDPSPTEKAKPVLVGHWPCAVFGTVAADGRKHAHRIYLAVDGKAKADLPVAPSGQPRDPKKSAKAAPDDKTSGRSVLWGDPNRADPFVLAEGIETAAAIALALREEVEAGDVAVAEDAKRGWNKPLALTVCHRVLCGNVFHDGLCDRQADRLARTATHRCFLTR